MGLFKVIAMFCAIQAGDNPEIGTMEKRINKTQAQCHAYYANCLSRKKWQGYPEQALMLCMKKRVQVKQKRKSKPSKKNR